MAQERKGSSTSLHIAMFPWLALGHMTPYLHLSNELAKRGHKISFLLPPKAKSQLEPFNFDPSLITLHPVLVPHVEGLPPGAETGSDIPLSLNDRLASAMDKMRHKVEDKLFILNPDFVFYDNAHWIPEIAAKIGCKTICYNVVSASCIAIALVPARNVPGNRRLTEDELMEPPQGYPSSCVVFRKHEAKSILFICNEFGDDGITFYKRIKTAMTNCDAIAIRTCEELEGPFCDYIGRQYVKPMLLTGHVLPELQKKARLEERWRNWLEKFEPAQVIFCCFGSQLILEKSQLQELVLGIESTELPFIVALKPPFGTANIEDALPEGFRERTRGRGIFHGGMIQQPLILNHPSIGCFVSHCGFGSMWESLMSDCQIVLIPHLGDQILNTRLLAEELKVAVEVGKDVNGRFSREELSKAIVSVMDEDSEIYSVLKENHAKWKRILTRPDFTNNYIDNFIEKLYELRG